MWFIHDKLFHIVYYTHNRIHAKWVLNHDKIQVMLVMNPRWRWKEKKKMREKDQHMGLWRVQHDKVHTGG